MFPGASHPPSSLQGCFYFKEFLPEVGEESSPTSEPPGPTRLGLTSCVRAAAREASQTRRHGSPRHRLDLLAGASDESADAAPVVLLLLLPDVGNRTLQNHKSST